MFQVRGIRVKRLCSPFTHESLDPTNSSLYAEAKEIKLFGRIKQLKLCE
jgi:hypothetical protein